MLWIWLTLLQTLQIHSCCYCVEKIGGWHVVTLDLNWRLLEHALPDELKPDLFAGERWTFEEMRTTCRWLTIIINVSRVFPGCKMVSWKEKQSIELRSMESAEASLEFSDSKLPPSASSTRVACFAPREVLAKSLVFAGSLQKDLEIPRATKFLHADHGPLQSPHSQNRRHSKGENSTTWCTIVCPVPAVQDTAGSIQWHDRFLMSHWWIFWRQRLISWRRQSEIQGPMGAQSMLLDILDSIQIGNHGLLVPTNLWVAVDWLDSDLFQGSNWPLFLQISIFAGRHSSQWVGTPWFVLLLFVGLTGRRGYLWVFCQCETAPSDPLCCRHGIWLLRESITWMHCISCTSRILQPWDRQTSE